MQKARRATALTKLFLLVFVYNYLLTSQVFTSDPKNTRLEIMKIENTQECFVQLWLRLERTRLRLRKHHKRFCVRHILHEWYSVRATDDFIWEVCNSIIFDEVNEQPVYGYDELPHPKQLPRKSREFLRALVAVVLDIGMRKVKLQALDRAYSIAFPECKPINVNKK